MNAYPKDCPAFKTPWGVLEGRPGFASIAADLTGHGIIEPRALIFTDGEDEHAHAVNLENPRRSIRPLTVAARRVLAVAGFKL